MVSLWFLFFLCFRWDDLACLYIFFQVQNCPAKYQIYMKSINGQIDVVLLNKDSVGSSPVVLPVPPPEDLLRSAKIALSTSAEMESSISLGQASANTKHGPRSKQTTTEDMQSSSPKNTEPNRTDTSRCEYFSLHNFWIVCFLLFHVCHTT